MKKKKALPTPELSPEKKAELERLNKMEAEIQTFRNQLLNSAGAKQAEEVPKPTPPKTVREKLRDVLTTESMDTQSLFKKLNMEKPKYRANLEREIAALKTEGKIFNVGWEDSPVWTWKIGNETDNETLRRVITRLIMERPMYVNDLIRATGAAENRVSQQLVNVQRYPPDGYHVVDMSPLQGYKPHGRAKMYFLTTVVVRDMTLQPSRTGR